VVVPPKITVLCPQSGWLIAGQPPCNNSHAFRCAALPGTHYLRLSPTTILGWKFIPSFVWHLTVAYMSDFSYFYQLSNAITLQPFIKQLNSRLGMRSMYSCMSTGQSLWLWDWVWPSSYAGPVCDDSAAEAAYAAILVLYELTIPLYLYFYYYYYYYYYCKWKPLNAVC